MTSKFYKGMGFALGPVLCCALVVSSASGQGHGRGGGGGGMRGNPGEGHRHGGGEINREILDPPAPPRGEHRGRYETPGIRRGPIAVASRHWPKQIFRNGHDNRNPFPGTPRRRRVRRGFYRHTHGHR